MGMFDEITCKYPLPVAGANELLFQTKDTPMQFLDRYEIRKDGTLWHELYDTEDRSERGKWMAKNPGQEPPKVLNEDPFSFCGCMTRVNNRWEQVKAFTGEIRFYASTGDDHSGWIEFSAYFENGKVERINLIKNEPPATTNQQQPRE